MKEKDQTIREELRSIAPELGDLPNYTGMSVPDGYFDNLADSVLQQVAVGASVRPLAPRRRIFAFVAAAVALLAVGSIFVLNLQQQAAAELLAGISAEQAYEYVYSNIDAYHSDDLGLYINSEDLDDIVIDPEELDEVLDELLDDINIEMLEKLL